MIEWLKNTVSATFRDRVRVWVFSFIVTAVLVGAWFFLNRPSCDLMFHPREVAKDYAIAWAWLFLLIGLPNRGRLACGVLFIVWMGIWHAGLVEYRIPSNQRRAVNELLRLQENIRAAGGRMKDLSEADPRLAQNAKLVGYEFKFSPEPTEPRTSSHYLVVARPQCYCLTGQMSFVLEESGVIHYTPDDRAATLSDPIVRLN